MLENTYAACKAILKTDPSITPPERNQLLAILRNGPPAAPQRIRKSSALPAETGPRLLRRREAAHRLGLSVRALDKLGHSGVLKRRILPGRQRGARYLASDIEALIIKS